ncbi:E3 ubiquitin-protein ligase HERC2 isoform X2 [Ooceraea biroi]|uniref:RCC1 domain-containing protein n=2 Tax=Ooceraea biroi TaxID=2015173 RepID=A0A026WA86_OOCBI|nr:E3 ubiquitin-protein ligase HERC2 isoform X2 [Ooceraea biroi]XP_011341485.1 E3 ubiquitin-protein ligase HERC2 isoform X2 [Ooceraea biroi]EZA52561.1 RCC1 domain-containing protein [Ooceraea biroi]
MPVYYTGLNASPLFSNQDGIITSISHFTQIAFPAITDIEIGWNYFLLWRNTELYITGKISENNDKNGPHLINIPIESAGGCKMAIPCQDRIFIFSTRNEIWTYKIYDDSWERLVPDIMSKTFMEGEYGIKLSKAECLIILSNLGRVFSTLKLINVLERIKFIDIACGFEHIILLAENGDIYSMGKGARGQLGHNDLETSDDPELIEALAGLKVVHISAGGWHSAVVTNQGDLYAWGWNSNGELGIETKEKRVCAVPTLVNFKNHRGETIEINVKKVECGNSFTVCLADDGSFWGCGSNKYGQLGKLQQDMDNPCNFVKLDIQLFDSKTVKKFKCHEWGTAIITE